MQWEKITNIILVTAFMVFGVFMCLGLCQLFSRKSLKKVDSELLSFIPPLALMTIIYFVFDKIFVLNVRPDGSGESSFPSSHVMVVATIFFITALTLPKYIHQKPLRIILDILMLVLIVLTAVGRVLADKHWLSDVIAGLVFAAIFAGIYYLITRKRSKHE